MSWQPDTSDYDGRKGQDNLLDAAVEAMKNLTEKDLLQSGFFMSPIKDSGGVCAYQSPDFILVAKKAPYGNLVSVSKHLLLSAKQYNKRVLMYLASAGAVYDFDIVEIFEKMEFENKKDQIEMINFKIGLGKRLRAWTRNGPVY